MYRTTTWKSCNDTTILYTTLHSRFTGRHAPHYGALLLHAPPELGKGYIHLTVANGAVNQQSPPHRSRCHHHRFHSRDQVTSGYTTKLPTPPARHGLKGGSRHTKEEVQTYTTEHDEIATPTDGTKQRGGYNTAHRTIHSTRFFTIALLQASLTPLPSSL